MIQLTSDSTDSTFWQSIFSLFQFKWKKMLNVLKRKLVMKYKLLQHQSLNFFPGNASVSWSP